VYATDDDGRLTGLASLRGLLNANGDAFVTPSEPPLTGRQSDDCGRSRVL